LIREPFAGPAQAALRFIGDPERVALFCNRPNGRQERSFERIDSAFAENSLGHDGYGIPGRRLLEGRNIVERNENNVRKQWQEGIAILGLASHSPRPRRLAVKRVLQSDDAMTPLAALVRPRFGRLHRRLHRLRAAVAQKDLVQPAPPGELFGQQVLIRMSVEIGGMNTALHLLSHRRQDGRVAIPQSVHADPGEEVQVAPSSWVDHVAAFSTLHRQGSRPVEGERERVLSRCVGGGFKSGHVSSVGSSKVIFKYN